MTAWTMTSIGTDNADTGTTVGLTTTQTLSINQLFAVSITFNNDSATTPNFSSGPSIAGLGGWVTLVNQEVDSPQAAADAGVRTILWIGYATTGSGASSPGNLNFILTAAAGVCAIAGVKIAGPAVADVTVVQGPTSTTGSTTLIDAYTPVNTTDGNLMVAAIGTESNTAPGVGTADSSVSTFTSGGGAAANVGTAIAWKVHNVADSSDDRFATTVSDGGSVFVVLNEAVAVTSKSGTESPAITISDTSSVFKTDILSASDTSAITATDAVTSKNITTTDAAAITITEATTLTGKTTTDTAAITIADTSQVTVIVNTTDTAAITAGDVASAPQITDTKSATDTAAITIADAVTSKNIVTTDTAAITIADSSSAFQTDILSATDTTAITISEGTSISGASTSVSGSESTAITIAESVATVVAVSTTDTAAITISDVSAPQTQFASTDTAAISVTDNAVQVVDITASDSTSISVTESQTSFLTVGGSIPVTENFATLPADLIKGAGVNTLWDNTFGNPAGSMRSSGNATDWWYLTDSKWTRSNFSITYDTYINSGTREISNFNTWVTSPGATSNGYMFRLDTIGASVGWYTVSGGNHSTRINSTVTVGGGFAATPGKWYRTTLTGNSATGTLTSSVVDTTNSTVVYADSHTVATGASGVFGKKQDALAGPGHYIDNIVLAGNAPTVGIDTNALSATEGTSMAGLVSASESTAISVAESVATDISQSSTDTAAITIADTSAVFKDITATDGAAISIADASSVNSGTSPAGNESTAISIAETTAIFKTMVATDTTAITITETASTNLSPTATDTAAVSVAEVATVAILLSTTDTTAITISDVSAPQKNFSATDTTAISVADAVTAKNITTTDTTAITITETTALFVTKSATDGAAVSVADIALVAPTITITATDTSAISVADVGVKVASQPSITWEEIDVTDVVAPQATGTHVTVNVTVTQAPPDSITVTEVYA